jgi:hypothetical protein
MKSFTLDRPIMPTPSFTIILPTVYGPMLVNRHDINQMQALLTTGRATDHNEIVMLEKLLVGEAAGWRSCCRRWRPGGSWRIR